MTGSEIVDMVANAYLSRTGLLHKLLDTTKRDLNHECGYPDKISIEQYHEMYTREGIGRRVVVCLPDESWAVDPKVYETEEVEETEFEKAWEELLERMPIYHYLHRIDELSGIGRFGILLLGLDDGRELAEPAEKGAERKLLYMRAFDESVVKIKKRVGDARDSRYGLPEFYTVDFKDMQAGEAIETISQRVHWTRVVHVADGRRKSEVFGSPRMEGVFNRLLDIRKVLSGSGEMFWKGAFPGFSFEMHPDASLQTIEIDKEAVRKEFEAYSEGLQRYLALAGLQAKSLSPQVSDPKGHVEAQLKAIAISLSIPSRVLFGSEQAQLASSQDARTWANRIRRRQGKYLTPMIIRPFVDQLVAVGVLPEPKEGYKVEWEDIASPSDEDKAKIAGIKAEALAKYVQGGVDQIIPVRQFLLQFMDMSLDQIEAIEEEVREGFKAEEGSEEEVVEPGSELEEA